MPHKSKWPKVGHRNVVSRQANFSDWYYNSEKKRYAKLCTCPWCDTEFPMFVRSMMGGGKRCPGCSAKVDANNNAHHFADYKKKEERCHSDRDGECESTKCPQLEDNEPSNSGRHCPLDNQEENNYE